VNSTGYLLEYDSSIESEEDADALDYYACFDALRGDSERCSRASRRGSVVAELVPSALLGEGKSEPQVFDGEEPIENWIATMLTAPVPVTHAPVQVSTCGSVSSISSAPRRDLTRIELPPYARLPAYLMGDDHTHSDQACDLSRRPAAATTPHGMLAALAPMPAAASTSASARALAQPGQGPGLGPVPSAASLLDQVDPCAAGARGQGQGTRQQGFVWHSPTHGTNGTNGQAVAQAQMQGSGPPESVGLHSLMCKRFHATVEFATVPVPLPPADVGAGVGVRISRVTEYVEDCY
jgi:hypothetical protein